MVSISMEEVRSHCRTRDIHYFDMELEIALAASIDYLRSIDVDVDRNPTPPALKQAILIMVTHLFELKQFGIDLKFLPLGVDKLTAPYRKVSL